MTTDSLAPAPGVSFVGRVKNILIVPRAEWPVIRSEPSTVQSIYTGYLCLLALVPALAGFIGMSLVGIGGFGMSMRVPIGAGLAHMVVGYVLWLATAYALAWLVNLLAPSFGGTRDFLAAFKVVAYSLTAAWLGGVFAALPVLSILGLLAALYSIYLLYLGLPVLMRCPPGKALGYTAVTVLGGFVLGLAIALVSALLLPSPGRMGMGMGMGAGGGDIAIRTPQGEVTIDARKLDDFAKKMEEAGRRMEQASKSGDGAAIAKAGAEIAGVAAASAGGRAPIDSQQLKAMLPAAVAGLPLESLEAEGNQAAGLAMSSARAEYGAGGKRVSLSINDAGALAGLAGLATWVNVSRDKETADGVERVYRQGGRSVRERSDKRSGGSAEYALVLPNGIVVEAEGDGVELAALKGAVDALPLARLEAAK